MLEEAKAVSNLNGNVQVFKIDRFFVVQN